MNITGLLIVLLLFVININSMFSQDFQLFTQYAKPNLEDYTPHSFFEDDTIGFSNGKSFVVVKNNGSVNGLTDIAINNDIRILIATSYRDSKIVNNYHSMLKTYIAKDIPALPIVEELTYLPEYVAIKAEPSQKITLVDFCNLSQVNSKKFKGINSKGAKLLSDFLVSKEGQELIKNFGKKN